MNSTKHAGRLKQPEFMNSSELLQSLHGHSNRSTYNQGTPKASDSWACVGKLHTLWYSLLPRASMDETTVSTYDHVHVFAKGSEHLTPGPHPLVCVSMPWRLRDVAVGWYRREGSGSSCGAGFWSCVVSDYWPFACPWPSFSPMAVALSDPLPPLPALCTVSHCVVCPLCIQHSHPDPQVAGAWPGLPSIVSSAHIGTRRWQVLGQAFHPLCGAGG